jgi:phosphoribosylformylglycinamidine cyclo-ligase
MKPQKKRATYRQAGVDIDLADRFVERIRATVQQTHGPQVIGGFGGFAGLFQPDLAGMTEPVLVGCTDGVGTKLKVAFLLGQHDTVGIDLVAMSVNDLVTTGAQPLFFLDYIAVSKLHSRVLEAVVAGIAEGCRQAGCALLGGETAELPGFYAPGEYDLAGFAVGIVERSRILDARQVKPGDVLLGLASSGLHSNGFSLARSILLPAGSGADRYLPDLGETVGEALLRPTRIYVGAVVDGCKVELIRGAAHITGGGITGNLPRILPPGVGAQVEVGAWKAPAIFSVLQEAGRVADREMYRVFNMGIGMILVARPKDVERLMAILVRAGETPMVIGRVVKRPGVSYVR